MSSLPSWFGKSRERNNAQSRRQEKKRAEEIGGKVQAGSGSSWRAPQDVKAEGILEQVKFTNGSSVTVDARVLLKLRDDALRSGREPQYTIDFEQYGVRLIGKVVAAPRS